VRVLELALTSRRAGARGADGAGAAGATPATPPLDSEHDIMAVTARALYAHGAKDAGAALVMRVLRESEEKHPAALLEYGASPLFAAKVLHGRVSCADTQPLWQRACRWTRGGRPTR